MRQITNTYSLRDTLATYLDKRYGTAVSIESIHELGGQTADAEALKQFGYGQPLLVTYRLDDAERQFAGIAPVLAEMEGARPFWQKLLQQATDD